MAEKSFATACRFVYNSIRKETITTRKEDTTIRKNFNPNPWLYSLSVAIISTYDEDGKIDYMKPDPITYDPVSHDYRVLGEAVGKAFSNGLELKKRS